MTADPISQFEAENRARVAGYAGAAAWCEVSQRWRQLAFDHKYMYHFAWLGRPVIQLPVDMVAVQEIIWTVRPDFIIETGIAHGGSLVLSASILALVDYAEALERGELLDPAKPKRKVLGVDIDIRAHNRAAIEAHPLSGRIEMMQGSSIAEETIARVHERARGAGRVMVFLDSNHTHEHVAAELAAYAPLTSRGSYCVVFDTVVEDLSDETFTDRPWARGNNPKTAVWEYLKSHPEFEIDRELEAKLMTSVAPDGYLKRIG